MPIILYYRFANYKNKKMWLGGMRKYVGAHIWFNDHALAIQNWGPNEPHR